MKAFKVLLAFALTSATLSGYCNGPEISSPTCQASTYATCNSSNAPVCHNMDVLFSEENNKPLASCPKNMTPKCLPVTIPQVDGAYAAVCVE